MSNQFRAFVPTRDLRLRTDPVGREYVPGSLTTFRLGLRHRTHSAHSDRGTYERRDMVFRANQEAAGPLASSYSASQARGLTRRRGAVTCLFLRAAAADAIDRVLAAHFGVDASLPRVPPKCTKQMSKQGDLPQRLHRGPARDARS